jgi:hypothetical protein
METVRMKALLTLFAGVLALGVASAGEVYVVKDAQGNPVYTDRPDTLPAEKLGVKSSRTDPADADARYEAQMKQYASDDAAYRDQQSKSADAAAARELSAQDRAKRCADARQRYEAYMNAVRLYEQPAGGGDRRYLSNEELDAARANAKRTMDEFCADQ